MRSLRNDDRFDRSGKAFALLCRCQFGKVVVFGCDFNQLIPCFRIEGSIGNYAGLISTTEIVFWVAHLCAPQTGTTLPQASDCCT